jgi:hypothetical protein
MLTMFFKMEQALDGRGWGRTKFRFRGHSERPFWSWVCSWAKCIRKPSDIGYSDEGFDLPPLKEREYIVQSAKMRGGYLFAMPAGNLQEEREDRRNSIPERVEKAQALVASHKGQSVVWCELNAEADALTKAIPGAKQVSGSMDDEQKEEILSAFSHGQLPCLVTKPKIGCWGLNWQHCSNIVMFPSHSFEQYYQAVRRCWRFGQKKEVTVSLILCEGEEGVLKSIKRKSAQVDAMFEALRIHMNDPQAIIKVDKFPISERIPQWV